MAGKIYVVYARAATGLKLWPIAAFFNGERAKEDAEAFAARAVEEGRTFSTTAGRHCVAKTEVRDYGTWSQVPALSRGL